MIETNLYTRAGDLVATVLVPPFLPGQEADVLIWGDRHFLRHTDGRYFECFAMPTFTHEELAEGARQGLIT